MICFSSSTVNRLAASAGSAADSTTPSITRRNSLLRIEVCSDSRVDFAGCKIDFHG